MGSLVGGNEEHKTDGQRISRELGGKLQNEEISWFSSLLKMFSSYGYKRLIGDLGMTF